MDSAVLTGLQMNTGSGLIACRDARSRKRTASGRPLVSEREELREVGVFKYGATQEEEI